MHKVGFGETLIALNTAQNKSGRKSTAPRIDAHVESTFNAAMRMLNPLLTQQCAIQQDLEPPCVRIVVASNFYLEEAKNESESYRRI